MHHYGTCTYILIKNKGIFYAALRYNKEINRKKKTEKCFVR